MEVLALVVIAVFIIVLQNIIINSYGVRGMDYTLTFSTDKAYEGDEIYLVECIHNRKLLPVLWLKVSIHSSKWLDFAGTSSVVTQDDRLVTSTFCVGSYRKVTRRWKLKCLKRGIFTTENVTLVWGDIFGMRTSSKAVKVNATLKVFPDIIDLEQVFTPVNYLQGDILVKRWIIDDPFIIQGAREYMPGDPVNRIHWQASAREGKLMVKKNDFTSQLSIAVLLNIQSIEYEYCEAVDRDKVELEIKAAATLFDRALRSGSPVRFGTNGSQDKEADKTIFTGEASGEEHISGILSILAGIRLKSVKDFEYFLEEVYTQINACDVIILTAYLSKGICSYARLLTKQGNYVRIIVFDHFINSADIPDDLDIYVLPGGMSDDELCNP